MARDERNRTNYARGDNAVAVRTPQKSEVGTRLIFELSDMELADSWERAKRVDPFLGLYDQMKRDGDQRTLECQDVRRALELFATATGDIAFSEAAQAMSRHGFERGTVRRSALRKVDRKRAAWAAAPIMHSWIINEKVERRVAAKFVAAQRGIPALSFEAAVKSLMAAYLKWLLALEQESALEKSYK